MKCYIVVMYLGVLNCRRTLQQIVYKAAGISYRFSVVMCLAVKFSLGSPTDSLQGCRYLFPAAYNIYFCWYIVDDHKTSVIHCCCHGQGLKFRISRITLRDQRTVGSQESTMTVIFLDKTFLFPIFYI